MTGSRPARPIRVALVNDYEIVLRGLASMLNEFPDWVEIVELDSNTEPRRQVDIALFDSFAAQTESGEPSDQVAELVRNPGIGHVAVYTWNLSRGLASSAARAGAHGYLAKSMTAPELIDALVRIQRGDKVMSKLASHDEAAPHDYTVRVGDWPGRSHNLTPRESEVIALITQGLSNNEIAAQGHLSINSVKSYIRSAYRKMGVTRRSQAVLWGVKNGFTPNHRRLVVSP